MRRLLWLVAVFVVLSVCVPSYGYFLIYNVSAPVKGVNNDVKATIPLKAYFVANLDDSNDTLVDANMIMYGTNGSKHKVYTVLNYSDANEFLSVATWWQGDYVAFDCYSYYAPFDFEGLLVGLAKPKNIGLADTVWVAASLSGTMIVWDHMLLDTDDNITGTGNLKASLHVPATTYANQNHWTQDQILYGNGTYSGLIQTLEDKGYAKVTPLLPPPTAPPKAKSARQR